MAEIYRLVCAKCNKIIEGYGQNHTEWLMAQHQLKHTIDQERLDRINEFKDFKNNENQEENSP